MKNQIAKLMVAAGFAGAIVAGTITSCDDNDNNNASTGTAGTGGSSVAGHGGTTGIGGTSTGGTTAQGGAGGTNLTVYTMTMSGSEETPPHNSAANGNVAVTLNRSNGSVTVTGTFSGLSSNATAAHIHGPAAVGMSAPVIVPLQVPSATSGAVTGTATMDAAHMDDMINGLAYVNIHSANFPDGEIRAQIK